MSTARSQSTCAVFDTTFICSRDQQQQFVQSYLGKVSVISYWGPVVTVVCSTTELAFGQSAIELLTYACKRGLYVYIRAAANDC